MAGFWIYFEISGVKRISEQSGWWSMEEASRIIPRVLSRTSGKMKFQSIQMGKAIRERD